MKANKSATGPANDVMLAMLNNSGLNINMNQLRACVSQLCDDGKLYTTIDDEHYKPTTED